MAQGKEYPWDKWFSTKTRTLKQGVHFDSMLHSMAAIIRTAAAKRDYSVSLSINEEKKTITITPQDHN